MSLDDSDIETILSGAERIWRHHAEPASDAADSQVVEGTTTDAYFQSAVGVCALTLPRVPGHQFYTHMGRRLVWWPQEALHHRRLAIVSSRLGERKDLQTSWFDALRTAVLRCDPAKECLCIVEGTAPAEAVKRAAILFGRPTLNLVIDEGPGIGQTDLAAWLRRVSAVTKNEDTATVFISPEVTSDGPRSANDAPVADRMLALAGERLVAISCRRGGNVESTILQRLRGPGDVPVLVHDDAELTPQNPRQTLIDHGAIAWILDHDRAERANPDSARLPDRHIVTTDDSPLACPEDWLCHWTRPRPGPWPGESRNDYLDALILGCESADHSAFAALVRIVQSGVILPSPLSHDCVSFTAVPLASFRQHRIYRKHLRRYDFETWGVAVRKTALIGAGAKPVRYVEEGDVIQGWDEHPRHDRSGRIDWSVEREWRLPGELQLSELSSNDVVIFVDTDSEAKTLAKSSPWQVIASPAQDFQSSTGGNRVS